jgi:hypothetical protein
VTVTSCAMTEPSSRDVSAPMCHVAPLSSL